MSLRSVGKKRHGDIHALEDDTEVVVTVTKVSDPVNGTKDCVVEKDVYVNGVIDALEVDKTHVEVGKGHVEVDTTHVEAGDGRLEIDKVHKDISKGGHVEITESHVEVKDGHVVEILSDTEADIKGGASTVTTVVHGNGDITKRHAVKDKGASSKYTKGHPKSSTSSKKRKCECHCNCCSRGVHRVQKHMTAFYFKHSKLINLSIQIVFLLCYYALFAYAMCYKFGDEGSIRFLLLTMGVTMFVLYRLFRVALKKKWTCCCWLVAAIKCLQATEKGFWKLAHLMKLKVILCILMTLFFVVYTVVVVGLNKPQNLISVAGMAFFIAFFFIFSDDPEKVRWRPVFCGISMQFVFAMLLMRTTTGSTMFTYLGMRITEFMSYADDGAKFVFGPNFADHFFAFKVLPVVIFFSTAVSVLFHLGVMQFVIKHIGRLLTLVMDTSPAENIVAVANIFVGQSEAPLLAGPYLETMTRSELHTVMTSGFATVAGPIMAAFALYKVPVIHLLSASVMSAPAAIAMSKLFYPENEEVTKATDEHIYKVKKRATNIIEAASNGAIEAIRIVANILAHLVAFVSMLMFLNAVFTFIGHRVGLIPPDYPELTFQLVYSYIFWPVSFLMGVDVPDCGKVAELIGTKMVVNEFAAYADLSNYIDNKEILMSHLNASGVTMDSGFMTHWFYEGHDIIIKQTQQILERGIISERSTIIATYALCGFSNASAMGVMMGTLVALIPTRKADISRVVFRSMIAGNVASFMTACMAGLLYNN